MLKFIEWLYKILSSLLNFFNLPSLQDIGKWFSSFFNPSSTHDFSNFLKELSTRPAPTNAAAHSVPSGRIVPKTYRDRLAELTADISRLEDEAALNQAYLAAEGVSSQAVDVRSTLMSEFMTDAANVCQTSASSDLTLVPIVGDNNCGYTSCMWGMIELVQQEALNLSDVRYEGLFNKIKQFSNNQFINADDLSAWMKTLSPSDPLHRFVVRMALAPALREYCIQVLSEGTLLSYDTLEAIFTNAYELQDPDIISNTYGSKSPYLELFNEAKRSDDFMEYVRERLLNDDVATIFKQRQVDLLNSREEAVNTAYFTDLGTDLDVVVQQHTVVQNAENLVITPIPLGQAEAGRPVVRITTADTGHFSAILSAATCAPSFEDGQYFGSGCFSKDQLFRSKPFVSDIIGNIPRDLLPQSSISSPRFQA